MHGFERGPVGLRIGGVEALFVGQHHHRNDAGHTFLALERAEAGQHFDAAQAHAGGVGGQAAVVFGGDGAIFVTEDRGDAPFGGFEGFGVVAAVGGQGLDELDLAPGGGRGQRGDAARRQVARPSAADARHHHTHTSPGVGDAPAQAIAEADRAGFGVEAVDGVVAAGQRQIVGARPGDVAATFLLDLHQQCFGFHRRAGQGQFLIGGAGADTDDTVAHGLTLVDFHGVDADPA